MKILWKTKKLKKLHTRQRGETLWRHQSYLCLVTVALLLQKQHIATKLLYGLITTSQFGLQHSLVVFARHRAFSQLRLQVPDLCAQYGANSRQNLHAGWGSNNLTNESVIILETLATAYLLVTFSTFVLRLFEFLFQLSDSSLIVGALNTTTTFYHNHEILYL